MAQAQSAQGGKDFLLKLGNGFSGAVTFQNAGDTVTQTAHGLVNGTQLKFATVVTTTTLIVGTLYYVVNVAANTFQVALTVGGAPVAIDADGTGTSVEYFQQIAGLRTSSFSFEGEAIDITNHDSSQWKEILDQAGIRGVSLSGEGVFVDEGTFAQCRTIALGQTLKNWRICVNVDGDFWGGCFKLTSMEQSGEYNAESTYSLSMESSGAVTYTTV